MMSWNNIPGVDAALLGAERVSRQIYWSLPTLRRSVQRWLAGRKSALQIAERNAFQDCLRDIGVRSGALIMAHTSVDGVVLKEANSTALQAGIAATAVKIADDLMGLLGPAGTLVMPSHAIYQRQNDDLGPADGSPQPYDPQRTPCGVGLINELFRRRSGVVRSLHPNNTLAAHGPLAEELMHDNLNDRKPLAHGVDSGYYRFCQKNGLVISIGIPLGRYMTLIHVAEDVRDREWPVSDFFVDRKYLLNIEGERRICVVRQRRPIYSMFCLCMSKLVRDLRREGILHEGHVQGLRVDWAQSGEVFDFMMRRNERSTYPYFLPSFVTRRWRR